MEVNGKPRVARCEIHGSGCRAARAFPGRVPAGLVYSFPGTTSWREDPDVHRYDPWRKQFMTATSVTVFGGSGFLGQHIVKRLAAQGACVRVAVRHPQAVVEAHSDKGRIVAIQADVREERSVAQAIEGAEAVVNAVSLYLERGDASFEGVHVQGAVNVARAAAQARADRLIHISGLGADASSESAYVRARAEGESKVREVFTGATILRPSVLFGPGDAFFTTLASITQVSPVVPLFGNGEVRLQPVFVGDVAEAVVKALSEPAARGLLYELGGPRVYSYRALVELLLGHLQRKRLLVPVPYFVWRVQTALLGMLPNPPLTYDQVVLMKRDNVVSAGASSFADLGISPTAVETQLPLYV
ncbi:MAG: complex I NDUFA9 subunit family protein [Gammaproteobacteria bacterium]